MRLLELDPTDTRFVPPTMRERLAKPLEGDPEFFILEGRPHVVWRMWDHAEDWSVQPVNFVNPFGPVLNGTEVTEAQFRQLVRAMHGIDARR